MILKRRETLQTVSEIRQWRKELNDYGVKYHELLIANNKKAIDTVIDGEIVFLKYAPFAVCKCDMNAVSADILVDVAEIKKIKSIVLSPEPQIEKSSTTWAGTLDDVDAYDIVTDGTYTGENIRIGILEAEGICNLAHSNFQNVNITVQNPSAAVSYHATQVTSVLTAIAPGAEYYLAVTEDNDYSAILDWFLDNACDIINCSFSWTFRDLNNNVVFGYQQAYDGYFDYIIQTYCITIVCAAGNASTKTENLNGEITSPGYAQNAITVGGVDRVTIGSEQYLQHASGACYISNNIMKPDIAAPFTVNIPNLGIDTGTSLSAPIVAGCIALLYQKNNNMLPYPEQAKALVTATASKTYGYMESIGAFDNKVGAGCINLSKMLSAVNSSKAFPDGLPSGSTIMEKEIYVISGKTLNVSTAWLVTSDYINNAQYNTNFDIEIYNASNQKVASSTLTNSNVELIRYTVPASGNYKIRVIQNGAQSTSISNECVVLTYYAE